MPVQIQQLSPDVYYVTPPGQDYNKFASFMATYLKHRTPWTRKLWEKRLNSLDPGEREAMLATLERNRLYELGTYQKGMAKYQKDLAEASEIPEPFKEKEQQKLTNALVDLEKDFFDELEKAHDDKAFENQRSKARKWLEIDFPNEIKNLSNQIDRGGGKYDEDAAGKLNERDSITTGSWVGGDIESPAYTPSKGQGELAALSQLADKVDEWSDMLEKNAKRESVTYANDWVPGDLQEAMRLSVKGGLAPQDRYRPSADQQAMDALIEPQAPPDDKHYEDRRQQIIDAYTNPFGRIGGPLPSGSVVNRRSIMADLFGGGREPRLREPKIREPKPPRTPKAEELPVEVGEVQTYREPWEDISWAPGQPELQPETSEEEYRRLAQEHKDSQKAEQMGVDELPDEPIYQEGFFEDKRPSGVRQPLEFKAGEEEGVDPELQTLSESDKITLRDPPSIQASTEPYETGPTDEDMEEWMPWATPAPGTPFGPSYQSQWAPPATAEVESLSVSEELDPLLTRSATASEEGIKLEPSAAEAANLRRLKATIIDPLAEYGEVTVAYRNEELQSALKKKGYTVADNSHHLTGNAVDLAPTKGKTLDELAKAAKALVDSGVAEKYIVYPPKGGKTGHVHITMAGA